MLKLHRGDLEHLQQQDPIVEAGRPILAYDSSLGIYILKIGTGSAPFNSLPSIGAYPIATRMKDADNIGYTLLSINGGYLQIHANTLPTYPDGQAGAGPAPIQILMNDYPWAASATSHTAPQTAIHIGSGTVLDSRFIYRTWFEGRVGIGDVVPLSTQESYDHNYIYRWDFYRWIIAEVTTSSGTIIPCIGAFQTPMVAGAIGVQAIDTNGSMQITVLQLKAPINRTGLSLTGVQIYNNGEVQVISDQSGGIYLTKLIGLIPYSLKHS